MTQVHPLQRSIESAMASVHTSESSEVSISTRHVWDSCLRSTPRQEMPDICDPISAIPGSWMFTMPPVHRYHCLMRMFCFEFIGSFHSRALVRDIISLAEWTYIAHHKGSHPIPVNSSSICTCHSRGFGNESGPSWTTPYTRIAL